MTTLVLQVVRLYVKDLACNPPQLTSVQDRSLDATLCLNHADRTSTPWSGGAVLHKSSVGADVVAYIHPGGHTMPAEAGGLMTKFFKEHAGKL